MTNPQLVVREMSVANLPAKEMRQSLPFQVRDMLPLAVERSLLDFHPLEEPGDSPTVRGLLIAMPKDAVMATVEAVEKAGLHVDGVDLASFAVLRAVSRLDSQVEAIVDIGAQVTSLVVHADGEPLIVRTVPRGGTEITESMAARLGVAGRGGRGPQVPLRAAWRRPPGDRDRRARTRSGRWSTSCAARSPIWPPVSGRSRSPGSPCAAAAR